MKSRPPAGVTDRCVEFVGPELACGLARRVVGVWPDWARWNGVLEERYTVGVEEEVMLLDASDHSLAQSSDMVLAQLSGALGEHMRPETHAAVIELATGIHLDIPGAVAELAALRAQLAGELRAMGVVCHAARATGTPGQTAPACEGACSLTCRSSGQLRPSTERSD